MISVSEASALILQHVFRPEKERIKIDVAEGRILADPVKADRDMPPFDRVAMDGIAIQFRAFEEGWRDFRVEALLGAGQPRITMKDPNNCIEVMTGAMLPVGCDTVIRYEDIAIVNKIAKVKVAMVEKNQFVHGRAHDAKKGDVLLNAGHRLYAAELALLATVGRSETDVLAFPKMAIVSTGDELVDIHDTPQAHQIRRSNSYALKAALTTLGCSAQLFHLPDEKNQIVTILTRILTDYPVVILSGGVSKGKFDYVPTALESLGVQKIFHEVSQRPGKPFFFGIARKQVVFALPGNPVSSFLCFYRYIKPWLNQSMGARAEFPTALLTRDVTFAPDLTYFLQVKINIESGKLMATPVPGGGSGDLANLKDADGFLELPAGHQEFKQGEPFPFISFRG